MRIFYGTKNGFDYGFYFRGMHKEIPEGAVEIPSSLMEELETAQRNHMIIVPDGNGYPVSVDPESQLTSDQLADRARGKREKLIEEQEWRIRRHSDEVALGITPTEDIMPVLVYIQALRDITKQPGWPSVIVWPDMPA